MAEGILGAINLDGNVIIAERSEERAKYLRSNYSKVKIVDDVKVVATQAELIFLAVRPQDVEALAKEVKPLLKENQTLVSIVAGKKLEFLQEKFGKKVSIVRVMPNLALRAKAGMCAICPDDKTSMVALSLINAILEGAGETVILEECDFDAVTALSGSGPAYFAYMEEAMMEGGIALGLKPEVARLLAEQTMYGTAKFLRESRMDLRQFIDGVCTKGGTTAAGMKKLATPSFKRIVAKTLQAAAKRSEELG